MSPPLPSNLVAAMAARAHRMHSMLWHEIRRFWPTYPQDVRDRIRALGWEPPRPCRDENYAPMLTNDSGQDFLFLHRTLNQQANRLLAEADDPALPWVEGWVRFPEPDDPDWPVPPPWFDPGSDPVRNRYVARIKTPIVLEKHFRYWERVFSDPGFLRGTPLGVVGGLIEFYVEDPFRRRWAAGPGASRPEPDPDNAESTISTEWDDPRYDYLSDPYSMHVNPAFWRFSGWVEDRLEEWKTANGVFGNDFWTARWTGPPEATTEAATSGAPNGTAAPMATLEELTRVVARGRPSGAPEALLAEIVAAPGDPIAAPAGSGAAGAMGGMHHH